MGSVPRWILGSGVLSSANYVRLSFAPGSCKVMQTFLRFLLQYPNNRPSYGGFLPLLVFTK